MHLTIALMTRDIHMKAVICMEAVIPSELGCQAVATCQGPGSHGLMNPLTYTSGTYLVYILAESYMISPRTMDLFKRIYKLD